MDRDELLDLERKGWDSLCDGSGADFYGRVMTDDGLMVLANGIDAHPFVGAMSSVYHRVDGEWRLALYQQTPVSGG